MLRFVEESTPSHQGAVHWQNITKNLLFRTEFLEVPSGREGRRFRGDCLERFCSTPECRESHLALALPQTWGTNTMQRRFYCG